MWSHYQAEKEWENVLKQFEVTPPEPHQKKVTRLTEFCLTQNSPVGPDPYYSGPSAFEQLLDLVEDASDGLTRHIQRMQG